MEKTDPELVTQAPRLTKEHGRIDWSHTAIQIANQVRAFQPWPASYSSLKRNDLEDIRILFTGVTALAEDTDSGGLPGVVVDVNADSLVVQTGSLPLRIDHVQPSGKKPMPVADFLRGNQVKPGDSFA